MSSLSMTDEKFHDELRWCISQLELGFQRQDPNSRQALEAVKILKILRSPKAPLVKKRQAMRNALGDYRKKMKESEKKFLSGLRNSKFQTAGNAKSHLKSKFLRQSHSRTVDRDELGSHLSSLNLQQNLEAADRVEEDSQDESFTSGSFSQQTSSGFVNSLPDIASFDSIAASRQAEDPACSIAQSKLAVKTEVSSEQADLKFDDHSESIMHSASSDMTRKSSGNAFHYVPSDNSFCFGFSNETGDNNNDVEAVDGTGDGREQSQNNDLSNSQLKSEDVKVKPNAFKYKRTDNSFVFNFS
ncbi:UPF0488 protein C8orf33 homolog [Elysia marginata]|uniref:UPF0488 protein C8orf33 homolog n=1 Tax=Elysia marginata TaxID=1093978 RepID=A0AAV4IDY6_9GAST|nr:UPF0488 protein C8orf33 homolog [Elysia marginata]